ncbi:FGGY-family carbohydrate kinase [Aureispira sp. CCB-E]|uniref:xylulokinase n=1 Tax=Aureispira sp. CCB-E TaxID=3051121 RepID=UPI0028692C61|nr:FGGY-family carbohydrate kinase [Aureispira sp. CCB-E]WMX15085.1 FGGY-family carbohydrate kinase [Aureispira sp. CCB-E]
MMMLQEKYVLAIDLGTSSVKVILLSSNGNLVDATSEKVSLQLLEGGGAEQNPEDWWQASLKATKRLLQKVTINKQAIVAIACTGQWAGTVPLDKNGQHLMNGMIWLDSRGGACARKAINGFPRIQAYGAWKLWKWIQLTGGAPSSSGKDSFAHILYIKENRHDIYQKTYKFLEPKDYLNYKWTNKMVSTFDTMTLHWVTDCRDIGNIQYHPKLLKMAGIAPEKLPDMIAATDVIGCITPNLAIELGLSPNVQVVGSSPDLQSILIGAGAVEDYQPNLCIGTSTFLSMHVPYKKVDILHNIATFPASIPNKYFIACEQQTSAICLSFLKDLFQLDKEYVGLSIEEQDRKIYAYFDEMVVQTSPGSNHLIFTPWLYGERCPVEDPYIRGGFHNLSLTTTRAEMIRAVYEGIALNARWLWQYVAKFSRQKKEAITMTGGGANSAVWCQIFADVLGYPILQAQDPSLANAKGAAMIALDGLGLATFQDLATTMRYQNTFYPIPQNQLIYNRLFKTFVRLYKKNKSIYYQLNL